MSDQSGVQDLAAGEPATTRILVALAAMSTRQDAIVRATDEARSAAALQHRELMDRVSTFVPRSEIEKDNKAIHDRIGELDKKVDERCGDLGKRIERVDGKIWKGIAWALGTAGTALAGLVGLHIKAGSG